MSTFRATLVQAFTILEQRFQFIDQDHCGAVTFQQLLRRLALAGFRDSQRLTELFEAVDVDRSGTLEFSEFLMLMFLVEPLDKVFQGSALETVSLAWKALEGAFSRHDVDDNLLLSRAELQRLLVAMLGSAFIGAPEIEDAFKEQQELRFSEFLFLLYSLLMPQGRYACVCVCACG